MTIPVITMNRPGTTSTGRWQVRSVAISGRSLGRAGAAARKGSARPSEEDASSGAAAPTRIHRDLGNDRLEDNGRGPASTHLTCFRRCGGLTQLREVHRHQREDAWGDERDHPRNEGESEAELHGGPLPC